MVILDAAREILWIEKHRLGNSSFASQFLLCCLRRPTNFGNVTTTHNNFVPSLHRRRSKYLLETREGNGDDDEMNLHRGGEEICLCFFCCWHFNVIYAVILFAGSSIQILKMEERNGRRVELWHLGLRICFMQSAIVSHPIRRITNSIPSLLPLSSWSHSFVHRIQILFREKQVILSTHEYKCPPSIEFAARERANQILKNHGCDDFPILWIFLRKNKNMSKLNESTEEILSNGKWHVKSIAETSTWRWRRRQRW